MVSPKAASKALLNFPEPGFPRHQIKEKNFKVRNQTRWRTFGSGMNPMFLVLRCEPARATVILGEGLVVRNMCKKSKPNAGDVSPEIARQIDENLKHLYAKDLTEELPESLLKLIDELRAQDVAARSDKQ